MSVEGALLLLRSGPDRADPVRSQQNETAPVSEAALFLTGSFGPKHRFQLIAGADRVQRWVGISTDPLHSTKSGYFDFSPFKSYCSDCPGSENAGILICPDLMDAIKLCTSFATSGGIVLASSGFSASSPMPPAMPTE